eukprot:Gb_04755 [translate_table: standard]
MEPMIVLDSTIMSEEIFGPILIVITFTMEKLPFGGVGEIRMGSYHGKFSFNALSHGKAVMKRHMRMDVGARYLPYSSSKLAFLIAILRSPHLSLHLFRDLLSHSTSHT